MAGDWRAVQAGLGRGFERGFATGGKLSGIGSAISKVAQRLKSQREGGEALETLGQTERVKARVKKEFAGPTPYGPEAKAFKFGPEAREFEEVKVGLKTPFTKGKIQTTLGELESGGSKTIYGMVVKFRNRQEAVNHVLRNLGPDWETISPEAKAIIDEKWGGGKLPRPRVKSIIGDVTTEENIMDTNW